MMTQEAGTAAVQAAVGDGVQVLADSVGAVDEVDLVDTAAAEK
jgi:hypothetical protein